MHVTLALASDRGVSVRPRHRLLKLRCESDQQCLSPERCSEVSTHRDALRSPVQRQRQRGPSRDVGELRVRNPGDIVLDELVEDAGVPDQTCSLGA